MKTVVLIALMLVFHLSMISGNLPSQTIIVAFDANCEETIQYLKSADQLPDVIAYRKKICSQLTTKDCKSVLELGCGLGTLLNELAVKHPAGNYLGIDHNSSVIDYARNHRQSEQVHFKNAAIDSCFETSTKYSTIIIERVLHCLEESQIDMTLKCCIQALMPEGTLIIVTPDFKSQKIMPESSTGDLLLQYMLQHTATTPISPVDIRQKLEHISGEKKLKIQYDSFPIVTRGFKETDEDLCLQEITAAAVRDHWIRLEEADRWLKSMQLNPQKVLGISDMYIFVMTL